MSDGPIEISSVLQVIATELKSLGVVAEGLQPILSSAYAIMGPCPTLCLQIQSCDVLTQKLHEIGQLVHGMASEIPVTLKVDARKLSNNVRLAELASLLLGSDQASFGAEAGELQIL